MIVDPTQRDAARRELLYPSSFAGSLLALTLVSLALIYYASLRGWQVSGLILIAIPLIRQYVEWSRKIADKVCQFAGVSLAGRYVETIRRSRVRPLPMESLSPLELKRGCGAYIGPGCLTALVLLFINGLRGVPLSKIDTFQWLFLMILAVLAVWTNKNVGKPEFKIDDSGVQSCDAMGFYSNSASWSQIESCDHVTVRETFGKTVDEYVILRNTDGKKLLKIIVTSCAASEVKNTWDSLLSYLTVKLTGEPRGVISPRS